MITLDNIKSTQRLLLCVAPSKAQLIAVYAIRNLRVSGADVEVPPALRQAYALIRKAEIMLERGVKPCDVDADLRNEQTYHPGAVKPKLPRMGALYDLLAVDESEQLKELLKFGATVTGRIVKERMPHFQTIPKGTNMSQTPMPGLGAQAPRPASTVGPSATERIKYAQEALALAEQAKAQEDAQKALEARLDHEEALARATLTLLLCIRRRDFSPQYDFAKFRKELNPLAETYGFRLVLVGDKTRATLTAL